MIDLPDFRGLCEPACIALWGNPDKRDRKELRWNGHDAYSAKTFSLKKRLGMITANSAAAAC